MCRDVPTPFGTWQTTALFETHDVCWHFDAPTIPTGVESYAPRLVPVSVTRVPPTVGPFVLEPAYVMTGVSYVNPSEEPPWLPSSLTDEEANAPTPTFGTQLRAVFVSHLEREQTVPPMKPVGVKS